MNKGSWNHLLTRNIQLDLWLQKKMGLGSKSIRFVAVDLEIPGFPGGSNGKESACNAGDPGLILGLKRSAGEGNGYPLQYSCLENSVDRGAWQATAQGVVKSQTQMSD